VVLVIVSLVVAVLVIDLAAFYLLGLRRIGYGPDRFFQHSSLLGWEHIPYAEGTWYAYKDGTRTHVSINAFGFPDDDRAITKDRPRIALVGDSTTEFWEVQEDERAPRVMERMLDGRVEVLNFGLRGAGTDQELIRFTNQVVLFSPDIVVLFFCVNDLGNNVTKESKPWFALDPDAPGGIRLQGMPIRGERGTQEPWPRSLLEESFTLRQLKYLTLGRGTFLRTHEPLETHFELRPFKRDYDAEDEYRLELLERLIASFAAHARAHHENLLLVEGLYRPALDDAMRREVVDIYGDRFDFDRLTRALDEHSTREGYEFLSLPRLVREHGLDVRQLMHREDTMHLNAEGVRLFSTAVIERIRALGWLAEQPAALGPLSRRPKSSACAPAGSCRDPLYL